MELLLNSEETLRTPLLIKLFQSAISDCCVQWQVCIDCRSTPQLTLWRRNYQTYNTQVNQLTAVHVALPPEHAQLMLYRWTSFSSPYSQHRSYRATWTQTDLWPDSFWSTACLTSLASSFPISLCISGLLSHIPSRDTVHRKRNWTFRYCKPDSSTSWATVN